MPFNLLEEAWLPVRRRSGGIEKIPPWRLTHDPSGSDPVTDVCAPRPDLDGALLEFLIGLTQTCLAPESERQWKKRRETPPTPEELRAAFAAKAHAFDLDGDGPRFMQDLTLLESTNPIENPAEDLFMDSPGEKKAKDNTDLFVKTGTVDRLCRACAAAALCALQTYAPSGGKGHRTSMRGGGPLTTLVLGETLWETVWNNVLPKQEFENSCNPNQAEASGVFPWLAPARTSTRGEETGPEHVHPLHMYWATPRRIRLLFEENVDEPCGLCGETDRKAVRRFLTRPHGYNYKGAWKHPLTPYRHMQKGEVLPVKGSLEGSSYRHWLGLTFGEMSGDDGFRNPVAPAQVVRVFREHVARSRGDQPEFRIRAFGFETDKMKVLGWCQGEMPVWLVDKPGQQEFTFRIGQLIRMADLAKDNLRQAVRAGLLHEKRGKAKADASVFDAAVVRFWSDTRQPFFDLIGQVRDRIEARADTLDLREQWRQTVWQHAERIFVATTESGNFAYADHARLSEALLKLRRFCSARNELVRRILDLPEPDEPEEAPAQDQTP